YALPALPLVVHHDQAPHPTDLRRREPDPGLFVHHLAHVLGELAHLVGDLLDRLRFASQPFVGELQDGAERHLSKITRTQSMLQGLTSTAAETPSGSFAAAAIAARAAACTASRSPLIRICWRWRPRSRGSGAGAGPSSSHAPAAA